MIENICGLLLLLLLIEKVRKKFKDQMWIFAKRYQLSLLLFTFPAPFSLLLHVIFLNSFLLCFWSSHLFLQHFLFFPLGSICFLSLSLACLYSDHQHHHQQSSTLNQTDYNSCNGRRQPVQSTFSQFFGDFSDWSWARIEARVEGFDNTLPFSRDSTGNYSESLILFYV